MKVRIAIAVLASAGLISAAAARASSSLVGEWTFDADRGTTIVDSSGNGNNGLLSGAVTWVTGFSGEALAFNGSPGIVQVPDSGSLEPSSAVTVAAWVKNNGSPGPYRYIAAKGWNDCIASSYALYTGPSGGLEFYIARQDARAFERSPDIGAGVWNGAWQLAVGTFDGSTVRLYVDGVAVGSGSAAPGALDYSLSGSNDFFIGGYPGCANRTFVGEIDYVRVWSTVLSPAQIAALMPQPQGSTPGTTPGGSLTAANGAPIGSSSGAIVLFTPRISGLRMSLSRLSVRRRRHALTKLRSTITYQDTQPARSTLRIERGLKGIRVDGRCARASTPGHGHGQGCTRWLQVESFKHTDVIGLNTIRKVLLPDHALTPGRYRIQVTPMLGQLRGASATVGFLVRS